MAKLARPPNISNTFWGFVNLYTGATASLTDLTKPISLNWSAISTDSPVTFEILVSCAVTL